MGANITISINQPELNALYEKLKNLGAIDTVKKRRDLLRPAAQLMIDEAKKLVPQSNNPHHRYKDGKIVATYFPGNLRRSLQILGNKGKLTGSIIAGPKRAPEGKTSGKFSGRRVDGWYAGIVERKKPYLRPAYQSKKDAAEKLIIEKMKQEINNAIR